MIFLVAVALTAGAAVIGSISAQAGVGEFGPVDLLWASSWFGLSAVGALVASRRPENRVGWLACLFALPISLLLFADEYARYALVTRPGSLPLGLLMHWIAQWPFFVAGALGVFVLLLFPDGRLPSPRWRFVTWATVAAAALGVFGAAFGPVGDFPVENPLLIRGWGGLLERAQGISGHVLIGAVATSFSLTIVRLRRARGEQRQQLKWFFYGFFLMLAFWSSMAVLEELLGRIPEPFDTLLLVAGVLALPVGIAVAILRYRLYDIDVVINKTLVYGALAAFITAVYVGVVVGIGSLGIGSMIDAGLALPLLATAIVAVAFQPVRQRMQGFANRLVYGERVTPYEAVTSFSHRMAESLSLDSVLPQMAEAAAKGVGAHRSRVKLLLPGGGEQVAAWPSGTTENSFDRTIPVDHQGERVGEIAVAKVPGEQINRNEEKLLQDLASQAGLAMHNLRLNGELRQKLIELQESRKRIVAAQDEERRRMERDIYGGLQRQLESIGNKLDSAKDLARIDPERATQLLDEIKGDTDGAIEKVRDLARGIFPKILVDKGLASAISAYVGREKLHAQIVEAIGETRFSMETESNVYFVIREALQNVSTAEVTIKLDATDDRLSLEIEVLDSNPSALRHMRDRIEALGGEFRIQSRDGSGTKIEARVPAKVMVVG